MTPEQLSKICTLLYGRQWQTALANDLNVTDRTVRRWVKAGSPDWADIRIGEFCQYTIDNLKDFLKPALS